MADAPRLGVFVSSSNRDPEALASLAQKAETLAFDSFWVPDHGAAESVARKLQRFTRARITFCVLSASPITLDIMSWIQEEVMPRIENL